MHRIIKAHLDSFAKSFGFRNHKESTQFENFVNYSILNAKVGNNFDLENVTTGIYDDGLDGVAVIIDEEIIYDKEDAENIFSSDKKNHDAELIMIQSKVGESYDLGEFLKFKEAILRFIKSEEYDVNDDIQKEAKKVFDEVLDKVSKIRDGKPHFTARFVNTGLYRDPQAIEDAKNDFVQEINELGYFLKVDIEFIDRDTLTTLWVNTYSSISAELQMFSNAALPSIHGIDEAYLAVVKAKDLVNNLLLTEEGTIRSHVFEENVRAFLGRDNPVNKSISETLGSKQKATRFPVLNNGITIVSPDVRVQGNKLHLENYQIVNGCQTSNVLYDCRHSLGDSVMVNLKIIETSNEDVFSELVRATNSQSKVDETQFLSLRPIVRRVESYFNSYEGQDGRLFLERRDRQYIGRDIPVVRTFSVNILAKCVAAMFFERPDLPYRYQKRMFELLGEKIFHEENKECVFYAACLALYRLHLLVASADIPQNMRKYKWHILVLVRIIVAGENVPKLNSRKIEPYCQKLISAFSKHGEQLKQIFRKAVNVVTSMEDITADRLKRQAVLDEMLTKLPIEMEKPGYLTQMEIFEKIRTD